MAFCQKTLLRVVGIELKTTRIYNSPSPASEVHLKSSNIVEAANKICLISFFHLSCFQHSLSSEQACLMESFVLRFFICEIKIEFSQALQHGLSREQTCLMESYVLLFFICNVKNLNSKSSSLKPSNTV